MQGQALMMEVNILDLIYHDAPLELSTLLSLLLLCLLLLLSDSQGVRNFATLEHTFFFS